MLSMDCFSRRCLSGKEHHRHPPVAYLFLNDFRLLLSVLEVLSCNIGPLLLRLRQSTPFQIHSDRYASTQTLVSNKHLTETYWQTKLLSSLGRSLHVLLSLLQSLLQSVESQLQMLMAIAGEHHTEPSSLLGEERLSLHIKTMQNNAQGR